MHFSNRIERLADALAAQLATAEPAAPLVPETMVIGHSGMDEWLKRALAARLGIAANLEFQQPAGFVWRLLRARHPDLPSASPLDRGPLVWQLYAALGGPSPPPAVAQYLASGDALSRFELADALATVFEQYQLYRPEWVLDWKRQPPDGGDAAWQAALWKQVADKVVLDTAGLYRDFVAEADLLAGSDLPERISVFGVSALAPVYLELLAAAAKTRDIHLYVPNPSWAYWGDIESEARLARWRLVDPVRAEYATSGHPLLAALGTQNRDFIELLHGLEGDVVTADHFEAVPDDTLLHGLQGDMLNLVEQPVERAASNDGSLQVHVCHSRRREVEVLHDALLAAFEADRTLGPEDILVMAPNMDDYSDHIAGVFGAVPVERHIPWSLSERSARAEHAIIEALLALLDLPDSRFKVSEVLGFLDVPAVARRFALGDDQVEALRRWVGSVGIRWGLDSTHRQSFDVPAEPLFTWHFGLERMLAGYALAPGDEALWQGVAPWTAFEGQGARPLGALCEVVEQLDEWRRALEDARPLDQWTALIRELLTFFAPETADEFAAVGLVRDALADLEAQAELAELTGEVPRVVARAALIARLSVPRHPRPFLSGRVTFCALAPMRSIPARIVWLLGMAEADFPHRSRAPGFDLIAAHPRRGDRARQVEDRALFLEALLAARDSFQVSYVGRSEQDNTELPASVVVNLLLDGVGRTGTDATQIVLDHPLQPFSASYRNGTNNKASYAEEWLQAPQVDLAPRAFADALPLSEQTTSERIALSDLMAGLANPARCYLDALGVGRTIPVASAEDDEPFALDGLQQWRVKDMLLNAWLQKGGNPDIDQLYAEVAARGWLPSAEAGRLAFGECASQAERVARAKLDWVAQRSSERREIEVEIGSWRVYGTILDIYPGIGLVHARAGALRAAYKLSLWLEHLLLAASGDPVSSRFVGFEKGRVVEWQFGAVVDAVPILKALCGLYVESLHSPLPLLPDLSWDLCAPDKKGNPPERQKALARLRARWRKWEAGAQHSSIDHAEDFAFVFRGSDELFGRPFTELAERVFQPMVEARLTS